MSLPLVPAALLDHTPRVQPDEAVAIARSLYGLRAAAHPLPGERDRNFLLQTGSGRRLVLKIANGLEDPRFLEAQVKVLRHLETSDVPCPRVVESRSGNPLPTVTCGDGRTYTARIVTWLPGTPLGRLRRHPPGLLADLGRKLGALDRALAGFDDRALHRDFHWDLAHGPRLVGELLPRISDPVLRAGVEALLEVLQRSAAPLLPRLRRSVIHNDANDFNVLVSDAAGGEARERTVTGILDLGDMVASFTAAEPAVAAAYVMLGKADPLEAAAHVVRGYHETHPLTEDELAALYGLACLRLSLSIVHAAHQQAARPDDPYLSISQAAIRDSLPALLPVHPRFAEATFRRACGLTPVRAARLCSWLERRREFFAPLLSPDPRFAPSTGLDWGVASPLVSADPTANTEARLTERVTAAMRAAGATVGIGSYDEARLVYWSPLFAGDTGPWGERRTVHLGLDLFLPPGTPVFAPIKGRVYAFADNAAPLDYGPVIILEHTTDDGDVFYTLYGHLTRESLAGLAAGRPVARGERFAAIGPAAVNGGWTPHLHFQLILDLLDRGTDYPGVCRPSERAIWTAFSPDPNLVLGIAPDRLAPPEPAVEETLAARRRALGPNLSIAYHAPLKIVRGWMQYLWDHQGRRFLDAYNNVPHVGHAHPRVVAAGRAQMAVLNTNTRYLHDLVTEYAERLGATFPAPLSVCYFVNSASEASELALRLARAHTGARDMIVLEGAYHGHTTSLIDLSPYKHRGPGGEGPPTWVHAAPLPDTYRGRYREDDPSAAEKYAGHVRQIIARLGRRRRRLAGFIAETCPSVGGQIFFPPGYLPAVYHAVRAAGGVCIADEVQTGYGRIGTHFWAFQAHGVVPDIAVLGKSLGNGHPIGAVVTRPEIARSFDNGMEFFSTYGGNTVSCAIGLAVLDVVRDENLQAHAHAVGQHLVAGLARLQEHFPLVGDVRGSGLFLGVELVADRSSREPATQEAAYLTNRMRELGVLLGTDGPRHNVIKIRPPMPFTTEDGDLLVAALERALGEEFPQSPGEAGPPGP